MFIMNVVQVGTKLGQEMNDDDISHLDLDLEVGFIGAFRHNIVHGYK